MIESSMGSIFYNPVFFNKKQKIWAKILYEYFVRYLLKYTNVQYNMKFSNIFIVILLFIIMIFMASFGWLFCIIPKGRRRGYGVK